MRVWNVFRPVVVAALLVGFGLGAVSFNSSDSTGVRDIELRLAGVEQQVLQIRQTVGARKVQVKPAATVPASVGRKGWLVRAFTPPPLRHQVASLRDQQHVGEFVHTGSWIDMNVHLEHEGIFLPAEAGLNLSGLFHAPESGEYVFAAHMKFTQRSGQSVPVVVACHVDATIGGVKAVLQGKLSADDKSGRAALVSGKLVAVAAGEKQLVDALIACDLPKDVSGADVTVRICVRRKEESGFRPMQSVLPRSAI